MCPEPENPSRSGRVNTNFSPPSSFVAAAMHLAVMSPAQWDSKFIADLAAKRGGLRKAQVMSIGGTPAAHQTSLLDHRFDMLAIANAALCR
jgi:hypothetical protein